MSQTRFFPNKISDLSANEKTVEIPQGFLTNFLERTVGDIEAALKPTEANASDGIYLGTAGIAYMYYHLSKIPVLQEFKERFLEKAVTYLEPAFSVAKQSSKHEIPSFVLGNSGIYAVAVAVYTALNKKELAETYGKLHKEAGKICGNINFLTCGSDELFVGRAGYVLGTIWLHKETKTVPSFSDLYNLCDTMVESGRSYARANHCPCPLMYSYYQTEYLGAAHGLCTILQALLTVPGYLSAHPSYEKDVKSSVDYLLTLQDSEGNFPCATDEIHGRSDLVHWCHGAGGMIYLMAKAYLFWKDPKYLNSCEKMGDLIWEKGLLKKGPGICHGIAGNGYAFLLLYRLTGQAKYLHRAIGFAKFIQTEQFTTQARTPDYPFSLYEGVAGTACFISDLLHPKKAAFPFSDVFE